MDFAKTFLTNNGGEFSNVKYSEMVEFASVEYGEMVKFTSTGHHKMVELLLFIRKTFLLIFETLSPPHQFCCHLLQHSGHY